MQIVVRSFGWGLRRIYLKAMRVQASAACGLASTTIQWKMRYPDSNHGAGRARLWAEERLDATGAEP
jgi:hypothetical protein